VFDGLPWPRDDVTERSRSATLPLFKPRGRRKPELVGCSVAIRRDDDFFLLTARHVVVDLGMADFHIWTPGEWVLANGQIVRTDPDARDRDPLDAAVIALDRAVVNAHLRAHALTIADFDPPTAPAHDDVMQLVGYPGGEVLEVGNKTLTPTFFQWSGMEADPSSYAKRGRKLDRHCVVDFDRAQAIHSEKGQWAGPDMNGASGAGIWRVLRQAQRGLRGRSALLSAIFTDYEGRTLIGTRIGVHVALLTKYFPRQKQ
jgi:hypothetical protein